MQTPKSLIIYLFILGLYGCQNDQAGRVKCPVNKMNGLTIDQEFGAGTSAMTQCLQKKVAKIKVVYQINKTCLKSDCAKSFALGNIKNAIKDYQITHGLKNGIDFEIVAIMHGPGYLLSLNNDAPTPYHTRNPFQSEVQYLLDAGVKIFYCQNTARTYQTKTPQVMAGIKYVTSGVTALAEYQTRGYSMIQP